MNRKMREEIKAAFEIPEPERKGEFLEKYELKKMPSGLMVQAAYIRKWVWIVSASVFLAAVWGLGDAGEETLSLTAVMMPFVSCIAVLESMRSAVYGMDELEAATRFSLRRVILTRIEVIGAVHLVLLSGLVCLLGQRTGEDYLIVGARLTVPYLLSSLLGMEAERRTRGRRGDYACVGWSVCVAVFELFLFWGKERLFLYESAAFGGMAAGFLFLLNLWECKKCCMETGLERN